MKAGSLFAAAITLALALPVAAQTADLWERGTDPATAASGLRHVATGVFLSCSAHGGLVHVTATDMKPAALTVRSGDLSALLIEPGMQEGKAHVVVPADDPALLAAATGALTVAGHDLDFSEKDRRYFALFLRICKAS